jgi:hypothetical protein
LTESKLTPNYGVLYRALHVRPHEAPFLNADEAEKPSPLSYKTQPEIVNANDVSRGLRVSSEERWSYSGVLVVFKTIELFYSPGNCPLKVSAEIIRTMPPPLCRQQNGIPPPPAHA